MPLRGIRTHIPYKLAAADPHLRPRGHRDRPPNVQSRPMLNFCKPYTGQNRNVTADKPLEIGAKY